MNFKSSKGKTRGSKESSPFKDSGVLKNFFSDEMKELKNLLRQTLKREDLEKRFDWTDNFVWKIWLLSDLFQSIHCQMTSIPQINKDFKNPFLGLEFKLFHKFSKPVISYWKLENQGMTPYIHCVDPYK